MKPVCFYHPSKVLLLDDEVNFLKALEFNFPELANMAFYVSASEASKAIRNSYQLLSSSAINKLDPDDTDTATGLLLDLNVNNLYKKIYEPKRFDCLTVIVVDYNMPEMTGGDFLRSLSDVSLMKIMLTGKADKDTAIELFNEGVINKFLFKHTDNLIEEIKRAIAELQLRYFYQTSKTIVDNLEGIKHLFACPDYLNLFQQVLTDSKAVEYYLLDSDGSFLFLDALGEPTWLIVRDTLKLQQQLELVEGLEAPSSIVKPLQDMTHGLFLLDEAQYRRPIGEWQQFLFAMKKLNSSIYYNITKGKHIEGIAWEKVVPYQAS